MTTNLKKIIGFGLAAFTFGFVGVSVKPVHAESINLKQGTLYTKYNYHGLQRAKKFKHMQFKVTKHADVKKGKHKVSVEYVIGKRMKGWIYTPAPAVVRQIPQFARTVTINHNRSFQPAYLYLPNISELNDLSLYNDYHKSTIQAGTSKRLTAVLNQQVMARFARKFAGKPVFQVQRGRRDLYYMVNPINAINGTNLLVPYNVYLDPNVAKDDNGNLKLVSTYGPYSKHSLLNPRLKGKVTGKHGEFKNGVIWYEITQPRFQNGTLINDYGHKVYQYNLAQHQWIKQPADSVAY